MNFFDAQDRARRSTRRLVVFYLLAAAAIVIGVTLVVGIALFNFTTTSTFTLESFLRQQGPILVTTAIAASLLIAGATIFKSAALSAGGGKVATDLGGTLVPTDVHDPLRRRLRNVVEEMAIASGVPVPEIYVLEQEAGINALAAGYAPSDAAIAVTRGTLELLSRDELQGVIAHEFSHILNGDMRLNIRLMGILFGIMVLGLIGRMVLRGGRYGIVSVGRRNRGAPAVLLIGLGLTILGGIGVLFARIIKASVSRQREVLADASAVQFTRQTEGLANALKKIGGYEAGSHLQAADPEEVSHMLFGTGSRLAGLFATHPPLTERIRALDPSFSADDYPQVDPRQRPLPAAGVDEKIAGLAAAAGGTDRLTPDAVVENVAHPDERQVDRALQLRQAIPETLYSAAHSPEFAYLLSIALILSRDDKTLERQMNMVCELLGEQRARRIRHYYDAILTTGDEYRLPLLSVAFPALKRRPPPHLEYLVDLSRRLIHVDASIDLYEYCYYRVLTHSLARAIDPAHKSRRRRASRKPVRGAAVDLLRIVASHGHRDPARAEAAFRSGLELFGPWAAGACWDTQRQFDASTLDRHLDLLIALNADGRKMLTRAIGRVILFDDELTATEAELMRAVCASLDTPLPPIIVANETRITVPESGPDFAYH